MCMVSASGDSNAWKILKLFSRLHLKLCRPPLLQNKGIEEQGKEANVKSHKGTYASKYFQLILWMIKLFG